MFAGTMRVEVGCSAPGSHSIVPLLVLAPDVKTSRASSPRRKKRICSDSFRHVRVRLHCNNGGWQSKGLPELTRARASAPPTGSSSVRRPDPPGRVLPFAPIINPLHFPKPPKNSPCDSTAPGAAACHSPRSVREIKNIAKTHLAVLLVRIALRLSPVLPRHLRNQDVTHAAVQ